MTRYAVLTLLAFVGLAAPGAAAADTTVVHDPTADNLTALDGTLVWTTGARGTETLMERSHGRTRRVPGAPVAALYSPQLGRDAAGRVVLSYRRCGHFQFRSCKSYVDDLHGHHARVGPGYTPKRCTFTTAPSVWGETVAYGVECATPAHAYDAARSGVYVRRGSRKPRRVRMPRAIARQYSSTPEVGAVELRGDRLAAIVDDGLQSAFSETLDGRLLRWFNSGMRADDADDATLAVALGSDGGLWALTHQTGEDVPTDNMVLTRAGSCVDSEITANAPDRRASSSLAVDGRTSYLTVPGTGIVKHSFAPTVHCRPPQQYGG